MSKITIKNISSATVTIAAPDIRFRRELVPGRTVPVSREEYDDLSFDTGFNNLIRGHYIRIDGLEEDEQTSDMKNTYDAAEIGKMLDDHDVTAFAKFIPDAAPAEKETAVALAIEKKIIDNGIIALIKKYCNVDVIQAINMKHLAEEK